MYHVSSWIVTTVILVWGDDEGECACVRAWSVWEFSVLFTQLVVNISSKKVNSINFLRLSIRHITFDAEV